MASGRGPLARRSSATIGALRVAHSGEQVDCSGFLEATEKAAASDELEPDRGGLGNGRRGEVGGGDEHTAGAREGFAPQSAGELSDLINADLA